MGLLFGGMLGVMGGYYASRELIQRAALRDCKNLVATYEAVAELAAKHVEPPV